jgi:hypothetical protein
MRVHRYAENVFVLCSVRFKIEWLLVQRGSGDMGKFTLSGPNEDFMSLMVTGLTSTDIGRKYALVAMGFNCSHGRWVLVAIGNVLKCLY